MDINLMVVNIGNSRIAMGAFVAGELTYVIRVPHEPRQDWAGRVAEVWGRLAGTEDPGIAAASVNPAVAEPLEQVIEQATGAKVQWVGRELKLPRKVITDAPAETGVDRVLNIAAAHEQMGKACVVVDAGTAITVDCCNDAGEFLGGAIAPGARVMLDALHEKTARLPRIELAVPSGAFGKNTRQAILQGVYHGIRGMVRELAEQYATELGTWPDIIATGGDAQVLFEGWELIHAVSPDLTLYGLALAYAENG